MRDAARLQHPEGLVQERSVVIHMLDQPGGYDQVHARVRKWETLYVADHLRSWEGHEVHAHDIGSETAPACPEVERNRFRSRLSHDLLDPRPDLPGRGRDVVREISGDPGHLGGIVAHQTGQAARGVSLNPEGSR